MRCDGGHGRDTRLLDVLFIIEHITITGSRMLRRQLPRVNQSSDGNSLTNVGGAKDGTGTGSANRLPAALHAVIANYGIFVT